MTPEQQQQDQPLWWVMQGAYFEGRHPGFSDRLGYAAEIRAVADWLVPEELEPRGMQVAADTYSAQRICQHERQALRQRLLAEADRAERGVEHD